MPTSITHILEQLEDGVRNVFESDRYRDFLQVMAKFHKYSAANLLLILMQCPYATQIAGMSNWNSLGRIVRKGEKSIEILAPRISKIKSYTDKGEEVRTVLKGYHVVHVFDVSQTEGADLPTLTTELEGSVPTFHFLMDAIIRIAECPVSIEKINNETKGFYSPGDHRIVVNSDLSELQIVKTLLHEVVHSVLHRKTAKQEIKDRSTREVEAESTAYVICQYLGLDTSDYSFAYLADWSSDQQLKELKRSLPLIQKTADEIINKLEIHFNQRNQQAVA